MLSVFHRIAGRPWAIRSEIAAHVRALLQAGGGKGPELGLAELRQFARLKGAVHAFDEGRDEDRPLSRRGGRVALAASSVAVIPIIGTLTQRGDVIDSVETRSTSDVADEVAAAAAEPKVDAIVLEVDSPGGEVYGVPEAFAVIQAARKMKPVVAHANSVAASAGFYLAAAADELWVTPSGEVGSVGVYALHINAAKALEDMGEEWEFVEADDSPYKTEGAPTGPLTEEARGQIKKAVNRYMAMFVRDLAKGRGVTIHHVQQKFGKGRMLGPQEAVEVKMADQVGTLGQAIRRAAELGVERRKKEPAARASSGAPAAVAGPVEAPNLGEGNPARSCMNCEYFSKPSPDHDGGTCSRHDFHTMQMWVCDDWEAGAGDSEPAGGPMERAAAARRRAL